jgi:hypothetical protein
MATDRVNRLDAADRAANRLSTWTQLPHGLEAGEGGPTTETESVPAKPPALAGYAGGQDRQRRPLPWYYSKMRIVYGFLALVAVVVYALHMRFEVLPADAGYYVVDHWLSTITFCAPPLSGIERQVHCSDAMSLFDGKRFFGGKHD